MREFNWGARKGRPNVVHDRVLTVANAITFVRLLGLPLFAWLVLSPGAYGKAWAVFTVVATTDWIDGFVARRFDQVTKLGKVLDPLVDRLLVAVVAVTLLVEQMMPLWVVGVIIGRDVLLLAGALALFGGIPPMPVTRTGKTATACLMFALPGFLLAGMDWPLADLFRVIAWIYAVVGMVGYYAAGFQYAKATLALRRERDEGANRRGRR